MCQGWELTFVELAETFELYAQECLACHCLLAAKKKGLIRGRNVCAYVLRLHIVMLADVRIA